jgi:hypothetical protein
MHNSPDGTTRSILARNAAHRVVLLYRSRADAQSVIRFFIESSVPADDPGHFGVEFSEREKLDQP